MVASSVIVALLLVAPSLAHPVAHVPREDAADLAERDPNFWHTLGGFAKKALPVAKTAASILFRRREDIADLGLTERDAAFLQELAARDPNFWHTLGGIAKKALPVAKTAASILFRREDFAGLDLSERELEQLQELAERDPNFWHTLGGFAKKALPVAKTAASILFRREDLGDLDLTERDVAFLEELAARDPNFWHTLGGIAKKALPVAKTAASILFRREDFAGLDLSERELAQLQELAERDPNFWHTLGGFAKKALPVAKTAASILFRREDGVDTVLELSERDLEDVEDELAAREEFEDEFDAREEFDELDEMLEREYDDIAELD